VAFLLQVHQVAQFGQGHGAERKRCCRASKAASEFAAGLLEGEAVPAALPPGGGGRLCSASPKPETPVVTMLRCLVLSLLSLSALPAVAQLIDERDDLLPLFGETPGCFVLYDVGAGRMQVVNPERAGLRHRPASTFKIANSLVALETGAVRDEHEVIPYGGAPQPFTAWEKDMAMREAIVASSVPVYQQIARRIGLPRMQAQLERLDYGNRQTGALVDRFWLDGPLEISAIEQARFLARLAKQELPLSPRSQAIVRNLLRIETRGAMTLYGKTGWVFSGTPQLGWWVGWIERGDRVYSFALNLDLRGEQDLGLRRGIGEAILRKLELL